MSTSAVPAARIDQVRLLVASPDPVFRKLFTANPADPQERVEEAERSPCPLEVGVDFFRRIRAGPSFAGLGLAGDC